MKNTILKLTLITILFTCFLGFGQFKAKMIFNTLGKERVFTIYSSENAYRYEFNEQGKEGVIIANALTKELIILMPQQKMAMKSNTESTMSMGNDPIKSYEYYKKTEILKEIGKETINGLNCIKSELYNKENPTQKLFTVWISEKYKFPIKMINHIDGIENSGMEITDLEPWAPTLSSFTIPEGYQIIDTSTMMNNKY
jgi:hypothetical protein